MVRNYKRKTKRGGITGGDFLRAANDIKLNGCSLRKAAQKYKIPLATLHRAMTKQQLEPNNPQQIVAVGYAKHRQVFNDEQELELVKYIKNCASIYYGLTPGDVRKLAYQFANVNNLETTANWEANQLASADWFEAFMKRHPDLSLHKPETTSLAQATAFNLHTLQEFMSHLQTVYERFKFQAHQVWNVDETGINVVQKPAKIVTEKGSQPVAALTSAEKATLDNGTRR